MSERNNEPEDPKLSVVIRLRKKNSRRWSVGIETSSIVDETKYSLRGKCELKSLIHGLLAVARVLEVSMLPKLAALATRNHEGASAGDLK